MAVGMGGPPMGPQHFEPGSRHRVSGWVRILAIIVGVVVAVTLVRLLLWMTTNDDEDQIAETAESTATTTTMPATTTTTVPGTTTTTAPPSPTPIPGLAASSLRQDLTDQGWYCWPPTPASEAYVESQCTIWGTGVSLTMYETLADEPVFIEVMVLFNPEYQWLEYIAALPWDGAEAETARSWVQQVTTGLALDPFLNSFGGVSYEMVGMPGFGTQWTLELGEEPLVP